MRHVLSRFLFELAVPSGATAGLSSSAARPAISLARQSEIDTRPHRFLLQLVLPLMAIGCFGCQPQVPRNGNGSIDEEAPRAAIVLTPEGTFEAAGLDDARAADLQVYVVSSSGDAPAIVGDRTVTEKTLRFTPRYPLEPGLSYRAVLKRDKSSSGGDEVAVTFEIPRRAAHPPTTVEHVYPSADRLPENQLKFYVHFSAPMSRGEAYRHVHLLDAAGLENDAVFLELGEELWDPTMRRFTLFFDPGRVKRGLKPREELGPVLEEGHDYTLVIDADWPDAEGAPLAACVRKSFHAMSPNDAPVDPAAWKIEPPPAGTSDPLVVRFPEPLDHALLERVLSVASPNGAKLSGTSETRDGETCWSFRPTMPWSAGNYRLIAATTLEDLAGNSIGRAFDVDVFGPVQRNITTDTISLPFAIGGEGN